MLEDGTDKSRAIDYFPPNESPSSKTQQSQNLVEALLKNFRDVVQKVPGRKKENPVVGRDIPGHDLALHASWLVEAHRYFRMDSLKEVTLSYVSEWMLDNYYIIRQSLQQIKEDLPSSFFMQLPKLSSGLLKGFPRIYAIARSVLAFQMLSFEPNDLILILIEFQKKSPLTMGELWALPIFLRYCLIESLSHELVLTINPPIQPKLPLFLPDLGLNNQPSSTTEPGVMESANNDKIANIILSLRAISEVNWNDFFESVSCLEQLLRQDPAEKYAQMDFKTRDLYRKEIETLSQGTNIDENEVGKVTLRLAQSYDSTKDSDQQTVSNTKKHIGEFLFGKGRAQLEAQIGFIPDQKTVFKNWITRHNILVYFFGILFFSILTILLFFIPAFFIPRPIGIINCSSICLAIWSPINWISVVLLCLALINPILTIATSLVNWLITLKLRPRVLPKLDFKIEIPDLFQTLVVIPAMINNRNDIDSLAQQLEQHYLRNPEPGLFFALLTDFRDADKESMPDDYILIQYAKAIIEKLNRKYETTIFENGLGGKLDGGEQHKSRDHFYFLHRKRLWNPSEGKWIGWERKRGKLYELNLLLRGKKNLSFTTLPGDISAFQKIHFVITLDSDTILPRGAACRLAGTLAHPLNQAVFDEQTGEVISGYTILQPRMEIHPRSANRSWFTRLFSGDAGLDLYSLAVSDAYQDFFGEGSFVGKGIYDVDAFLRSVDNKIPENTVLSHDLLEGVMGRTGLVTDITMIEDYPQNYFTQTMRQRRWIRGDWQLLPWLLQRNRPGMVFSSIDRWKMFDNLRRAMLAPSLMLIVILGILFQPSFNLLWTTILLLTLGIPIFTGLAHSTIQFLGGEDLRIAFRPLGWNLLRWFLAIAFLPYEAYIATDAILTTLYRLFISRRDLLQWTTSAQTARLFGSQTRRNYAWQKMAATTALSLFLAAWMQFGLFHFLNGTVSIILFTAPILVFWLFSPLIVWLINRPFTFKSVPLSEEQTNHLRQITRRTWGFFERFVGPGDHWLPPDHFQESPVGIIAHRTSPTNIGLLLTSTVAAYDLGYLDQLALATRLATTMDSLDQLERFRGHFLNWYDTQTLQPLQPRYVSTVDSGNLAASLIVTAQACKSILDQPIFRWDLWQGYLDTLSNLTEMLKEMRKAEFSIQVEEINLNITKLRTEILSVRIHPELWYPLFLRASGPFWHDLSLRLMDLVKVGSSAFNLMTLEKLQEVAAQVERHHSAIQRTLLELVPWIPLFENIPDPFTDPEEVLLIEKIQENLPLNLPLGQIRIHAKAALPFIITLQKKLTGLSKVPQENNLVQRRLIWLDELKKSITRVELNSDLLRTRFIHIFERAEQFITEMDFKFLYQEQRSVFHIGYNLDGGVLDQNYYDLLASESRIASVIAIAKGDVPQSHWLHLGRPVTQVEGMYVLLSWSGTMFEYLMPPLFLRSYPGTLLADSSRGAVQQQIAYGRANSVPWGISESGFYRFDTSQNYQYRAFGVPGLGFKRGLADDMVISPYSSLIAISYAPSAVIRNIEQLISYKMIGLYGVYESIDFTADRLHIDEKSVIVSEYMAHHQGMIMMAMANFFHEDIMVQRMHADPRIQSVELILQEQIPQSIPIQDPYGENVSGTQRLNIAPVEIVPWRVPVQTPIPQVHLLSNGSYNVLLSNMGGGYSSSHGVDLTRWQPDGVLDPWGTWIYIQEMNIDSEEPGIFWSACHQPVPAEAQNMQVTYFAHMAVFHRMENGLDSNTEITVAPDDPVEIRRIHLYNNTDLYRTIRLTSYGEVILSSQDADSRHPAFNKLFIESEFVPDLNLQIYSRRSRSDDDATLFMGHMLVVKGSQGISRHEADRSKFIGRGRSMRDPIALSSDEYLTGTTGATLDPIFSIGQSILIAPHDNVDLAYLTFTAENRDLLLAIARRYRSWLLIDRTFHQANITTQTWLGKQDITTQVFRDILQILSALLYPFKAIRAAPEMLASNSLGQPGLWRFGISGDYPILLVQLDNPQQIDLVREVLQVHKFLRSRRFKMDLVILNCQQTDYGAELNGSLFRLVSKMNGEDQLNQRGGVFILYGDQLPTEEYTLLQTTARVILDGAMGSLDDQIPGYSLPVHHLPEFTPTLAVSEDVNNDKDVPLSARGNLKFENGFGGFSSDGREYIINWDAAFIDENGISSRKTTPAPWVNVIGYPSFGFMVSESGSQSTWALNSGENRLTPWSNDPVSDPTGEALYLRDEETGEVWTPTPLPAGASQPYRVIHGAGYTIFEHNSHGLEQVLTLFASPDDPVKIIHLKLKNTLSHTRRITATQYIEWVLGTTHAATMAYIIPEYDSSLECLMATNPYSEEFGKRVAFLIASRPIHGLTADRIEFLGRGGTFTLPVALCRMGLETRISPGEDPCAVLQIHLDLLPGASDEIYFVLGQGNDKAHAVELVKKYHNPAYIGAAYDQTKVFWNRFLDRVQVQTPEPATDLILNRWMLYQTLSCRIWGRTGFYQSSGAFGFRDQLQDVLALLPIDPTITRNQILYAARQQFEQGDVMHWWHPPSGRGVRTRFSDDLLWLPYVTSLYIEATGDLAILDEKIPFRNAPQLKDGEDERYGEYPLTEQTFSLLDHCLRAIEKGATTGLHGLPLMGTGDWNDGMNRVGEQGHGESVWLAWFLSDVLNRFGAVCGQYGNQEVAERYKNLEKKYLKSIESSAWDGDWYLRAFYDSGETLGSARDAECQIDAIAQSWSVLNGSGHAKHSRQAMQSVLDRLVKPQDRLSLLFTPPFDTTLRDPGYIKGYFPGTRENGGQYTHAATWTAWAFAKMGEGQQANELFNMLNPVFQSDSFKKASTYRVEPYVICADIYSKEPFIRRGGWTWYTGSAAWMYRLGLEAILGFNRVGNALKMDPVIPPDWDGFEIRYQFGASVYLIQVKNPKHVARNVMKIELDGHLLVSLTVPLIDDHLEHTVSVLMGKKNH
jgi:cyclic beta-1,2-glucan synthetase